MKKRVVLSVLVIIILSICDNHSKVNEKTIFLSLNDSVNTNKTFKYILNKAKVLGKFDYKNDSSFVRLKKSYSSKTIFLRKETAIQIEKMINQARIDSIELIVISGTRNFEEQKWIWERKWKLYSNFTPLNRAKHILKYSSMPGSSRHHWGTDIDLNNLNNSYFEKGKGKSEYEWLVKNASDFGFYQVYTDKNNGRTGYELEKWHWSYLPLANQYLNYYNEHIIVKCDINDFLGSEYAEEVKIKEEYVNGIAHFQELIFPIK